jgi:DNA-binding MarR family transcriptional regulator
VQVRKPEPPVEPAELGLGYLCSFIGVFADRQVRGEMRQQGFGDLRRSHGLLVQHLLRGPYSVGELAELLGVSQQAVSKTVAELTQAGYLESSRGKDARVRVVQLGERGYAAVRASRNVRQKLERRWSALLGKERYASARGALVELLDELGGSDAVRGRRVPADEG